MKHSIVCFAVHNQSSKQFFRLHVLFAFDICWCFQYCYYAIIILKFCYLIYQFFFIVLSQYMQFYWQTFADRNFSDIALDDIEITPGECNVSYPLETYKGKYLLFIHSLLS